MSDNVINGGFAKFSLVVRTIGPIGIMVIAVLYLLTARETPAKIATTQDIQARNHAQLIDNQKIIIQTLQEIQKTTLRQSIILENVVATQEYMIRNGR